MFYIIIVVYFRKFRGSEKRESIDQSMKEGPWTQSIFCWTWSMDQGSMFCAFPDFPLIDGTHENASC